MGWIYHRGHEFASSSLMAPMTEAFVSAIEKFAKAQGVDLVRFEKGQRKDDVAQAYLARFQDQEGVLFIGKAQEKTTVVCTERRYNAFRLLPRGFTNRDLREQITGILGRSFNFAQMSYDLRRFRLARAGSSALMRSLIDQPTIRSRPRPGLLHHI